MTWTDHNILHTNTALCDKVADSKLLWMAMEEAQEVTETAFRSYGCPITNVMKFKYIGCILASTYDEWEVVVSNLRKARNKWA